MVVSEEKFPLSGNEIEIKGFEFNVYYMSLFCPLAQESFHIDI